MVYSVNTRKTSTVPKIQFHWPNWWPWIWLINLVKYKLRKSTMGRAIASARMVTCCLWKDHNNVERFIIGNRFPLLYWSLMMSFTLQCFILVVQNRVTSSLKMWWLPCFIKGAGLLVLVAHSDVTAKGALCWLESRARCLAGFYLEHTECRCHLHDFASICQWLSFDSLQIVAIHVLTIPAKLLLRRAQSFLYTRHLDFVALVQQYLQMPMWSLMQ